MPLLITISFALFSLVSLKLSQQRLWYQVYVRQSKAWLLSGTDKICCRVPEKFCAGKTISFDTKGVEKS
jgi:hypothetical protein